MRNIFIFGKNRLYSVPPPVLNAEKQIHVRRMANLYFLAIAIYLLSIVSSQNPQIIETNLETETRS